ncbi:MAG: zinc-dependent alcohol dehydrogenase family protein [Armatimonadota bacterium]
MLAMVLDSPGQPLRAAQIDDPEPAPGQIRVRVRACGVCRTDLHLVDGELPNPKLPVIPGHEIVGEIDRLGDGVTRFRIGDRVGIPWLGWTCSAATGSRKESVGASTICRYCATGRENLCDNAKFHGYTLDGGYAQLAVADERYCFKIPSGYPDIQAAPLLCAGLIGYRSLRMAGDAQKLGLYGFGASAHIVAQIAVHEGREVFAFVRPGDLDGAEFARSLGAVWANGSDVPAPVELDAAIIFAPVGALVPTALRALAKGGTVVCAGIHMSDIPSFPYSILWGERVIRSVANLTRADGDGLMQIAPKVPIKTHVQTYPLTAANQALSDLRDGRVIGAAVLVIE